METVRLEPVTPANFRECVALGVGAAQASFVASNVYSLAQSKVYPRVTPMAVYAGAAMVGFVMYGFDEEEGRYYLIRVMIDERFQGRGYGRAAVSAVLGALGAEPDCREVFLSVVPGNDAAEKLYRSLGFARTGETNASGEHVMRRALAE